MKVHVLGGFLGAGKTTAIRALAGALAERGERVAIVSNDQGHALVDTTLAHRSGAAHVAEIQGGCFCCRYGDLEEALRAARAAGATVALAEAVGSCTDLVATVLAPLAERESGWVRLAPLSVLVDPFRAADADAGRMSGDVSYLFRKQIEEADVVVLTRADLDPPDAAPFVRRIRRDVPIVRVSGLLGVGVSDWLATVPTELARPLDIDYDRYAAAEAELGWANARVTIAAPAEWLAPRTIVRRFFAELADAPLAHLKLAVEHPAPGSANVTRRGERPRFDLASLPLTTSELRLLVNARIALVPTELERRLRAAMAVVAGGAAVTWSDVECFQPSRPVPVHRYSRRCDPAGDASCCAAFYDRPSTRYLLGDSFHPGGIALTMELRCSSHTDTSGLRLAWLMGTTLSGSATSCL